MLLKKISFVMNHESSLSSNSPGDAIFILFSIVQTLTASCLKIQYNDVIQPTHCYPYWELSESTPQQNFSFISYFFYAWDICVRLSFTCYV